MKTEIIDITNEHCPMTFVKTKLALEKLAQGDRLEVTLKGDEPLKNVPRSAKEQGYKIIEISDIDNDLHKIIIEKWG